MPLLPLWFEGLDEGLRRIAEVTLGETSHIKAKALVDFRRLINEQPDIYSRLDEVFLLRFLRAKKFDAQRAFAAWRNYYAYLAKHRASLEMAEQVLRMNCVLLLPYRLPPGAHVAVYRMGRFDVRKATVSHLLSAFLLCFELLSDCEATQVCGGVAVIDLQGVGLQHCRHFLNLQFVSFLLNSLQDCLPERLRALHFVREPRPCHGLFRLLKPLLRKKVRDRIHFHGDNLNSLHGHIPRDFLPSELGGNLGPYDNSSFLEHFRDQEHFFRRISKYGILGK